MNSGARSNAKARALSLAYLTACNASVPEAFHIASASGYSHIGLRLLPNGPGAPCQPLIGDAAIMRATKSARAETGVGVLDLEIIRIGENFDLSSYTPFLEVGAELGAKAVLVAGDDKDETRMADNYARLCAKLAQYGLTADLEFMPWTGVPDARAAMRIVERAGSPANAGILVDALHVGRSTTSLDDLRAIPRQLLHYAQICDATAGRNFTTEEMIHTARCARLQPGEGTIDLRGIFATLPPDLPISVEVVHFERMKLCSSEDWARQCLATSQPYLG